jgi:1-aminocyclopropane-1-carboxylate deaminase/D-cysteine desulfhydrase-like pyridoxal-dependent ACC family enzyme
VRDRAANPESEPALFRAWPALRERVPWTPLGRFPTRVARLTGLLPDAVELWVKHEDESGTLYGGNKVRKLEFLLAEARARGARRVATLGAIGSHHVLATALYGRQLGFEVEAVVFPQPITAHVREQILADCAAGATLRPTRGYLGIPAAVLRARRAPETAWITAGGSSVTGTLGYVSGGLELLEQVQAGALPRPDVVYVALGSNGTAAGLMTSLWTDIPVEIAAVRVSDRFVAGAGKVEKLARATAAHLTERLQGRWTRAGQPPVLRVIGDQLGAGYGHPTRASEAAVAAAAEAGLTLEPTYTGKCMAALLADARAGLLDGKRVLFLQTFSSVDLRPLVAGAPAPATFSPLLRRHFE